MSPKELSVPEHQHLSLSMSTAINSANTVPFLNSLPTTSVGMGLASFPVPSSGAMSVGQYSTATPANNQQYCLKWNNHQSNMLRAFDRLLQSEAFTDVTLAADGRSIRAHKVVLSACSSYFETLFEEQPDKNTNTIIILKDMKYTHVSQLVNFMYRGEINITQDMLAGLLKTAETLKVKGLADVSGTGAQQSPAEASSPPDSTPAPPAFSTNQTQQSTSAAQAVQAAAAAMAYRIGTNTSSASSVLTAALSRVGQSNSPSPPSLAPLAALLAPQTIDDERRANLLKRLNSSSNLESDMKPLEPLNKIARRDNDFSSSSLLNMTNNSSTSPPPNSGQRQNHSHFLHASPPHRHNSPSLLHSSHFLNMTPRSSSSSSASTQLSSNDRHTPIKSSSSPLNHSHHGGLTPIPQELTVNVKQELPSFLQGYMVFKLNDYLGFRTRQQFWEEPSVRRIMEGIKNKEIDMKTAAELLGVSYGTLYGRYREVFGYLKHSWVNKGGRTSMGGMKENRTIWDENRAQELILAVLNKELSLTAAAVRLGVDTTTFLAHLTDNGKNKQRLAQLVGPTLQSSVLGDSTGNVSGLISEHAASLLAEHQSNLMDLMMPEHLRGVEEEEREEVAPLYNPEDVKPNIDVEAEDLSVDHTPPPLNEEANNADEDEDIDIDEKTPMEHNADLLAQYNDRNGSEEVQIPNGGEETIEEPQSDKDSSTDLSHDTSSLAGATSLTEATAAATVN